MFRPFLFSCLMIAMLLTTYSGCGGSTEVAQAPAAAAPAPAPSPSGPSIASADASGGSGSGGEGSSDGSSGEGMSFEDSSGSGMGMMGPPALGGEPGMEGEMGMGMDMGMNMGMGGGMDGMQMPGSEGGMGMPGFEGGMGMGMMGMGNQFAPPEDPAPGEEDDYLTKGRYAFSIGKESEGIDYARAFAIVAPEGADVLQKTKWFGIGMRPATTIRFAVGVVLEAPAMMTDFKPIGSTQTGGGGGGMAGGSSGGGAALAKTKEHALYDLTGTFGEAVITGLKERWSSGNFGSVFSDVEKFEPKVPGPNSGMGMGMGSGMMGMNGGQPGLGMGMEGMGMEGMSGSEGMPGMGGGAAALPTERIMPGKVIAPGMVYIGSAEKQADLMQKAVERGVDVVVLFDVKATGPNRINGIVQNETRVRVVSARGDMLARSAELLNTKVQRALASPNGEDEVGKAMEKFFFQFDEKVKLTELPAMKPEHATARLIQLLSSPSFSKIDKLFEVSLYHSLKLISDEDKTKACLIVMEGSEGESLANGRPEDKQAVLDPLLPAYK